MLLADPPWAFKTYSAKGLQKSAQSKYGCMTLEDIMALPVADLAHPEGCWLVCWATAPMLPQAVDTMKAWGFAHKSAGAWAKRSSTGAKWAFGTGYAYRSAAEFWLLGARGKPLQLVKNVRNLIVAPIREHSRKPDEMRANIERMWPADHRRLRMLAAERGTAIQQLLMDAIDELFARAGQPPVERWHTCRRDRG